jgi:hypothetical protein
MLHTGGGVVSGVVFNHGQLFTRVWTADVSVISRIDASIVA